jgi:PhnB protein
VNLGATLYVKGTVEAVEFYRDAFGMALGYHVRYEDGTFLHAELTKGGSSVFAVSESVDLAVAQAMCAADRPTMSLGVDLDSEDELRHAYRLLSDGGKVLRPLGSLPWSPCSADVIDRFGVCWYIYVQQEKPDDAAMAEWLREGNAL